MGPLQHGALVGLELVVRAARADRRERRLGGGMPDSMALCEPLMRGTFTKPAAQPSSAPPGKASFGTDCQPPSVMRAGAVGDALAALEGVADGGMRLEALELVEGREVGVLVVEVDDEADRHQVVAEVVEERAAAGAVVERPAERVLHEPRPVLLRARPPTAP